MKRVYFIKPIAADGPIKIGCSVFPPARKRQLQSETKVPLEIVATIPGDTKLERRFHTRFIGQYLGGEWFSASPELSATIAAIADGTFDLESLPLPQNLTHWTMWPRSALCSYRAVLKSQAAA